MAPGLVDSAGHCAAAPRPTLGEAELRSSRGGKAVRSAGGDGGSWAVALPARWALGENHRVLESFTFVAAMALTVRSGGGGVGVSDGHGSQPMEAGASKVHPEIGPFQFLMANDRREGGLVCWVVFSSCGRAPLA